MSIADYIQKLINDVQYTRWQEWLSTITQIWSVWLARKNNILVFPVGLVGLFLAVYLYYFIANPPLYADSLLNVYYILMSGYGWYNWHLMNDDKTIFPISISSKKEGLLGMGLGLGSWVILYCILVSFTNSDTPILDSLVSGSAVAAMWWMTRRKIENWMAYGFSNIVAIPLNFYKGFMLFTLMYVLFLFLSIIGYMEWNRKIKSKRCF
jgi:nicotinamide mononucleotide transporter